MADCPTRWNSTEAMFDRAVVLEEAITKVLEEPEWERLVGHKFSARHWDTIKKVVSVLKV